MSPKKSVTTHPPVTANPLDERRGEVPTRSLSDLHRRLKAYFSYVGGKRRGRQQSLSPRGEPLKKSHLLYEGKAKKIYSVVDYQDLVWMEFKDNLTAFNAKKKGAFEGKGIINCQFASFIFSYLKKQSIPNHWLEDIGECEMLCQKVEIIPLEVVVRNRLAGSTAKKFNIKEGTALEKPLVEFYYKDDELSDPFISDEQALMLKTVKDPSHLNILKNTAFNVNRLLQRLFAEAGIELIDFKLEFGLTPMNEILLADEITPDSCRLWDMKTGEKLDKDRFRYDLGHVKESYLKVWNRLNEKREKL